MPVAKFRLPDGRIARFNVPEGTTPEQAQQMIAQEIQRNPSILEAPDGTGGDVVAGLDTGGERADPAVSGQPQAGAFEQAGQAVDRAGQAITSTAAGRGATEFAAAFNRGATRLADFLTTDQINAVAQILGSEFRVPSITETASAGTAGGFMEPGLGRDVVRGAGEFVPAAVGGGAAAARAAAQLPRFTAASEGAVPGIIRQAGQTTAQSEAALGAASGGGAAAGREAGGAVGEAVGGEEGRQIGETAGEVAGAVIAPVGAALSASRLREAAQKLQIDASLADSIPSVDQLKNSARQIFNEIDESGARVSSRASDALFKDAAETANRLGVDRDVTPKAARALARVEEMAGQNPTISEIETIRRVAQNAAKAVEPADAAAGAAIVDTIDSFVDKLTQKAFIQGELPPDQLGQRFREARELWGRSKRAEMIEEAMEKARDQASGFENGIRTQFRQILNNKKKARFFKKPELEAMKRVVQGTKGANLAKIIGRLGFSEGGATNILGAGSGALAGGAVGGIPGAIIVPAIGQVSRGLAQKLTARNARFADQVIRAGNNGRKIADAYFKSVPKSQRNAQEFSELLIRGDIDLSSLPGNKLSRDAVNIAQQSRLAATREAVTEEQNNGSLN